MMAGVSQLSVSEARSLLENLEHNLFHNRDGMILLDVIEAIRRTIKLLTDPTKENKTMADNNFESTDDQRTDNNTMRHKYRPLTEIEKEQMQDIKDKGLALFEAIGALGSSRECSLAKTKSEEAVMWAVKHITG